MGFNPLKVDEVTTEKQSFARKPKQQISWHDLSQINMTHGCDDYPNTIIDHPVPNYPSTALLQTQTPG